VISQTNGHVLILGERLEEKLQNTIKEPSFMPTLPPKDDNTYFIDIESGAETTRLMKQDRFLTTIMGGVFSEQADLSHAHDILDIACGPGGWVNEVASTYPAMEIIGVDLSERMIAYARAHAHVRRLANASFRVMDVTRPLDFPEDSFDLVNARCIFAFMSPQGWPALLAECKRILRPGGVIRFTEGEWGVGTTPAYETYLALFFEAMHRAGRSFSATGRHVGITPVMARMFREAGFKDIRQKAHVHDFSSGSEAHTGFTFDLKLLFKLLQPFILKMDVATQERLDALYEQVQDEMQSEEFCALAFYLTVWGEKPGASS
jgi:ubiquinone/menaquinone biosynthesis C-methylase UbiE